MSLATAPHNGDYGPQDWRIGLSELLRLVTHYNHREGTTRTGQYHVDATTVDGFAPGPVPEEAVAFATRSLSLLSPKSESTVPVLLSSESELSPDGGQATLTVSLIYDGSPSSLGMSVALPTGWSFVIDTSTGTLAQPFDGQTGTIEWAWFNVPPSGTTYQVTVAYPSGLETAQTLTSEILSDADVTAGVPLVLELDVTNPNDTDGDGLQVLRPRLIW